MDGMAVDAGRVGVMACFLPAIVLVGHDVAVCTRAGVAAEVRRASWIEVRSDPGKGLGSSMESACAGLGAGERSVIYLASGLKAAVVLIEEDRARRVAKNLGLAVAGSIAVLERGARLKKIPDLRSVYLSLLDQGIRFNADLLEQSLIRCGLGKLKQ